MKTVIHLITILPLLACVITGCASSKAKEGAILLTTFTHELSTESATFSQQRTELAKMRRANVAEMQESAVSLENAMERDFQLWKLNKEDKRRVELVKAMTEYADTVAEQQAETQAMRTRHEQAIAKEKSTIVLKKSLVTELNKELAKLGEDEDLCAQVFFLTKYFQDVRMGIDEAKKAAEEQMSQAEVAADIASLVSEESELDQEIEERTAE